MTSNTEKRNYIGKIARENNLAIKEERFQSILYRNVSPTRSELNEICVFLKIEEPEKTVELLEKLPSGKSVSLRHRHPSYILAHPEKYEAFGLWLRAMRESEGLSLEHVAEQMGFTQQALNQIEHKRYYEAFRTIDGTTSVPENFLVVNPYGFPVGEDGLVTLEFRSRFIELSKPRVMKSLYDEAEKWISEEEIRAKLKLNMRNDTHIDIAGYWRQDTAELEPGCSGSVVTSAGQVIDVRRHEDGRILFAKAALEILRKEMGIKSQQI